jgi:hypothetical protein
MTRAGGRATDAGFPDWAGSRPLGPGRSSSETKQKINHDLLTIACVYSE